ncbi:phenylalanine--tRNA ligase subunit alpha [Candidatus Woesearchaeota archaeon]|nr:phenylalanine--tRNA ligase subunit alpha [Candidatus Woesearchaeota archaeon]
MEIEKTIATLHPLERKVLPALKETNSFDKIAEKTKLQKVEVMRALQWLQNKKLVRMSKNLQEEINLGENGLKYKEKGLPEKSFLQFVMKHEPCSLEELQKGTGLSREEFSISLGILKSKQLIDIAKEKTIIIKLSNKAREEGKKTSLLNKLFEVENFLNKPFPIYTSQLKDEEKKVLEELKKRKEIVKINIVKIITAQPTEIGNKIIMHGIQEKDILDRLTVDVLKSGSWKNKKIRSYDVSINVPNIFGGKRHFVNHAVDYIKKIWMDLGFKEMNGNFVQTSFWDLDALFVPQDHPARDMQDTFYIKEPAYGKLPQELMRRVKATHENGWTTGSKGWQYEWSERIAKDNLLRTHTTVLSAQTIAKLKKEGLPAKFFSVGKVFRNETLSWKSLFEFIQVEGIVVDPNANFKHLKGYLKEFFAKMGFPDVRIRPGHFPYTEPSCECDVWHSKKNQWVEVGGAGIFRPEVVKPLLGFECPVLAWGLGMERTIMEYYNITDVRDIYKNDLKQLREAKLWMK